MAYGLSNGHVTDDVTYQSRDPRRCCETVWSPIPAAAWLLVTVKGTSLRESTLLSHFVWL